MHKIMAGRGATAAAVALLFCVAMAGCTNKATETSSGAPGVTPTSQAAPPALKLVEPPEPAAAIPSQPAKKNYQIGVSLYTQDDPFYKTLRQGLEDQAAKMHVTLKIVSADKDFNKQVNQLQNFVAEKVDAIVVCPVDSQGIIGAITAANQAGVPVFTADIASKGGKVVSQIASDNIQGGRLVGDYVGKTLLPKGGNVAILDQRTVSSVQDRVKGFKDALAAFPGIKIVADQDVPDAKRENAVPKATNMLIANPDINVIFGINDPVALGALSALQQAKNTKVDVVGFDATPEAQNYIASGTSALRADAIQYPHLIGITTVDAIVKSLNGGTVPPKIAVPTGLVTKDSFQK